MKQTNMHLLIKPEIEYENRPEGLSKRGGRQVERHLPSPPFPSRPSPFFPSPFLPSLPLEVGPLKSS